MQLMDNKTYISELLSALFDRLNKEKVTYCLLRNYEGLPEKVQNDVDIWVKDGEQRKFQNILFDSAKSTKFFNVLISTFLPVGI